MTSTAVFRSILCPVDFSEHSVHALRLAVGLAGRDQARLTLLTVNDVLLVEAAAAAQYGPEYVGREAAKELRELLPNVAPGRIRWAPEPHIEVRTGSPDTKILECAAECHADLIVMGTHGLSGYRKMFFGSVTERVLRRTSVPVLAVPISDRHLVTLADRAPVFNLSEVMTPVDFGRHSEQQIRRAAEIARTFSTSLLVVHVVAETRAHGDLHHAVKEHERLRVKEARERLGQVACANSGGVRVNTHVAYGRPADEIARIAIEHDIGFIVMGLTGQGAAGDRVGSVAYRVLTMGPAPNLGLPFSS